MKWYLSCISNIFSLCMSHYGLLVFQLLLSITLHLLPHHGIPFFGSYWDLPVGRSRIVRSERTASLSRPARTRGYRRRPPAIFRVKDWGARTTGVAVVALCRRGSIDRYVYIVIVPRKMERAGGWRATVSRVDAGPVLGGCNPVLFGRSDWFTSGGVRAILINRRSEVTLKVDRGLPLKCLSVNWGRRLHLPCLSRNASVLLASSPRDCCLEKAAALFTISDPNDTLTFFYLVIKYVFRCIDDNYCNVDIRRDRQVSDISCN